MAKSILERIQDESAARDSQAFPSFESLQSFDPDNPFDARAEEIRKRVVEAFTTGDFIINQENAEATLAGLMVGVVGVAAVLLTCTETVTVPPTSDGSG